MLALFASGTERPPPDCSTAGVFQRWWTPTHHPGPCPGQAPRYQPGPSWAAGSPGAARQSLQIHPPGRPKRQVNNASVCRTPQAPHCRRSDGTLRIDPGTPFRLIVSYWGHSRCILFLPPGIYRVIQLSVFRLPFRPGRPDSAPAVRGCQLTGSDGSPAVRAPVTARPSAGARLSYGPRGGAGRSATA